MYTNISESLVQSKTKNNLDRFIEINNFSLDNRIHAELDIHDVHSRGKETLCQAHIDCLS